MNVPSFLYVFLYCYYIEQVVTDDFGFGFLVELQIRRFSFLLSDNLLSESFRMRFTQIESACTVSYVSLTFMP